MNRRKFLLGVSLLALSADAASARRGDQTAIAGKWSAVKIGGGGYVTGIDLVGSTVVCRTDTAGAFIWNGDSWDQLITKTSFAGAALDDRGSGVVEVRIAPSNPDILYMVFQGDVWKSKNRGSNWTATALNYATRSLGANEANANSLARAMGPKIAIDPVNPDIVYVSTPSSGVKFTKNGGRSWQSISTSIIPAASSTLNGTRPGHPGICFDPASGSTNGATNTIYVPSYGNGVYQSSDSGKNWSVLSGGPTNVGHAKVAADGIYYAANVDPNPSNTFYKFANGAWTNISPGSSVGSPNTPGTVICDPNDATRIILAGGGGALQLNTSRGATGSYGRRLNSTRSSPDIPWLAWTRESFMSLGDMVMDTAGKIWFAEGIGVWTCTFSGSPGSITWTSAAKGIENLSTNEVTCPPNGRPVLAGWDRSTFHVGDPLNYQSDHSPDAATSIRMAWGIDYASSDPAFVAYASLWSNSEFVIGRYSTQGGRNNTFSDFKGFPTGGNAPVVIGRTIRKVGGCIACASPTNIIIVPSNDAQPWYTKDGGLTWSEISIPGTPRNVNIVGASWSSNAITFTCDADHNLPIGAQVVISGAMPTSYSKGGSPYTTTKGTTGTNIVVAQNVDPGTYVSGATMTVETGWGHAYYSFCKSVAADRVAANTFYLYNYLTQKTYRSQEGGDSWTQMGSTVDPQAIAFNYRLIAVPGQEGHLFISGGSRGNPGDANPGSTVLQRTQNGGATWTRVGPPSGPGAIREPLCVGFGRAKAGQSYPAIYFAGWLNIAGTFTFGIYRSSDDCSSWESLGDYPINLFRPKNIDASKEIYGEVYVAMGGAGYMFRSGD